MAIGQMPGEVIGPEHRQYTMGSMPQHSRAIRHRRAALTGPLLIGLQRDRHLVDHGLHLGQCLPGRLAGLPGDDLGQRTLVLAQQAGKAGQHRLPLGQRAACPGRERRAGRVDGQPDITGTGRVGLPQQSLVQRIELAKPRAQPMVPGAINQHGRMQHAYFSSANRGTKRTVSAAVTCRAAAVSADNTTASSLSEMWASRARNWVKRSLDSR